jgi:hypothetical protein
MKHSSEPDRNQLSAVSYQPSAISYHLTAISYRLTAVRAKTRRQKERRETTTIMLSFRAFPYPSRLRVNRGY